MGKILRPTAWAWPTHTQAEAAIIGKQQQTTMTSVTDLLLEAIKDPSATSGDLLSSDGTTLTLQNEPFPASKPVTLDLPNGKSVTYSLASVYLQLCNPGVLQYRKACEAANVEDPVKVLDRGVISEFFSAATSSSAAGGDEGGDDDANKKTDAGGDDAMDMSDDDNKKDKSGGGVQFRQDDDEMVGEETTHKPKRSSSSSDKKRPRSSSHDKKRSPSAQKQHEESAKKKKKVVASTPMTNEQLLDNLSTIVGKREQTLAGKEGEKATDDNNDKTVDSTTTTPDSRQVTPAATPLPSDNEQDRDKEKELLMSCLSLPKGFDVNSPEIMSAIASDREATRKITSLEIPVGDSSSILRAGAGGEVQVVDKSSVDASGGNVAVKKRDFARVLEIYQEVIQAEEKAKRGGVSSSSSKRPEPPALPNSSSKTVRVSDSNPVVKTPTKAVEGNPIIVVPNAMTSCITMINAGFFFGKDAVYIPRDQAMKRADAGKRGGTIQVKHKLAPRLGGAEITYDIIDNPATRLKKEEWSRVVAVIAQGAAWQFKGWKYSDPVDLFSRAFGFYIGLDGASVPEELRNWNVKLGKVSRDRRGQDNICLASFWNGLEEFIAVHKQEYMK
jgi:parafibromin